ncbi:hypothetical protein CROQUDRAFT_713059 [Cronartium quercuum f. sp. fusiforme G11]|uniref:Fungal lipase-type domain-containing protein n=1 Tax=Cronartium quercuum f. sp. fusiforme G11 TaxID=708437 RepID=A0A9P6TFV2_9BASI|nr:hypothetical protein CROQUDRAFT_713059 [Cronartium quercuum f. sp. fusiforme G11]
MISGPTSETSGIATYREPSPQGEYNPFLYPQSPEWRKLKLGDEDEKNYYIRVYNRLSDLQKKILTQHALDLISFDSESDSIYYKIKNNATYVLIESGAKLLFRNILLQYFSMYWLTRPLENLYAMLYFQLVYSILFFINILFFWNSFDGKRYIFDCARPALGCDLSKERNKLPLAANLEIGDPPLKQHLEFNIDISRAILLLCAIVYERDTKSVQKAAEASFSSDGLHEAVLNLVKSEEPILRLANEWGLRFVSIADFRRSGSFAGIFYSYNSGSEHLPFMIITIKGTSPDSFRDILIDCESNLESSGDFLGTGMAHEGFYDSLFPSKTSGAEVHPYRRIIERIKMIARSARQNTGLRSNLFIGGHSLGAGLASLLYARLLESPKDLGDDIVLRDAYTFGTPRTCDAKLATRIDFNLNNPSNQGRQMWRIANRSRSPHIGDCITRVPPGMADNRDFRGDVSDGSQFAYAAVGIRVDLKPNKLAPKNYSITEIPVGYTVDVVKLNDEPELELESLRNSTTKITHSQNIVQFIMEGIALLIPILHDHLPASYMDSLNQMQAEFILNRNSDKDLGKVKTRSIRTTEDISQNNENDGINGL